MWVDKQRGGLIRGATFVISSEQNWNDFLKLAQIKGDSSLEPNEFIFHLRSGIAKQIILAALAAFFSREKVHLAKLPREAKSEEKTREETRSAKKSRRQKRKILSG